MRNSPSCVQDNSVLRTPDSALGPPDGETGSRPAYTRKSEVRLLLGRPLFNAECGMRSADSKPRGRAVFHSALRTAHSAFDLPRGITSSAPVSDTGGPGAEPGEAAILGIFDF